MDAVVPLILVSTRDIDFYLFIDHVLQNEKLTTRLAIGAEETRIAAVRLMPGAILLDCRGHICPSDICASVKQGVATQRIPIIALTNSSPEEHYNQLIQSDIDDILVRPILPSTLIERLRSVLPAVPCLGKKSAVVRYAGIEMNLATYRVKRDGDTVRLSPIEFKLLRHLLERPEEVITREELQDAAWLDNIHVGPRTIDVHVGRLRKALRLGGKNNVIRTVRSVGYSLSMEAVTDASTSN